MTPPSSEGEGCHEKSVGGNAHRLPLDRAAENDPQPIAAAQPTRRPRKSFAFSFTSKASTLSSQQSRERSQISGASTLSSGGFGDQRNPSDPLRATSSLLEDLNDIDGMGVMGGLGEEDTEAGGGVGEAAFASPPPPRRSIFRAGSAPRFSNGSPSMFHRRASVESNASSVASSGNSLGSAASGGGGDVGGGGRRGRGGGHNRGNGGNVGGGVGRRSTFIRLPPLFTPSNAMSTNSEDEVFPGRVSTLMTSNVTNANGSQAATVQRTRLTVNRRYAVGDYVLISNDDRPEEGRNSGARPSDLVNRYGFPEWGGGMATTSEERRGPYIYLLAKVVSVHYGEHAQYYTVQREDDGGEQRADAQWMEPITNPAGIEAAKMAAHKWEEEEMNRGGALMSATNTGGSLPRWMRPCADICSRCRKDFSLRGRRFLHASKKKTGACLNGNQPYGCTLRLTGINFFVLCSIWYLYIDQLRLAFMPHSADFACAVISCIVWIALVLELVMEIFIRPTGYRALIKSDQAYLPSTARYISNFHIFSETISLAFFVPEFMCLFSKTKKCGDKFPFSLANACLMSIYGPDRLHAFYGTAFLCMMRLRIFGLVRHWTKMWLNNTFVRVQGANGECRVQRGKGLFVPQGHRKGGRVRGERVVCVEEPTSLGTSLRSTSNVNGGSLRPAWERHRSSVEVKKNEFTDDYHLTNASKIGTALFMTNAQRALIFVFLIGLFPLIKVVFSSYGGTNQQLWNSVELLQSNNIVLRGTDNETCTQLETTLAGWVKSNAFEATIDGTHKVHSLSLSVEPKRCDFQETLRSTKNPGLLYSLVCGDEVGGDGILCEHSIPQNKDLCASFCLRSALSSEDQRLDYLESVYDIRPSVTIPVEYGDQGAYSLLNGEVEPAYFSVRVLYNETLSVRRVIILLFALQLGTTLFVLLGLSVLRYDAGQLVLGPLRRMLKIVAFYAKNPLMPPPQRGGRLEPGNERTSFQKQNAAYYDSDEETTNRQLGTFETEQLINAVTKITDLLRKCWGVAGAGIISSNLARQEGGLTTSFNPTVPGKAVYALFAFVSIDKFQSHLHALKGDIMILINDIAHVLHEEVYRWAYHERGECNKNLGGSFFMVYKIGDVTDVLEKREMAEAVIFSKDTLKVRKRKSRQTVRSSSIGSRRASIPDSDKYSRSHVDNIDLSSLPGMRKFTDRALLGLLKTFASIHRDKTIMNWNKDFRLGAGVGAASINLNFGMDAGWAVEGAVGSSYKIDATYLSPHVNMASRMMSATKQYGVYFLLSQAVERLLSENAQEKLRHVDTVTVKGSSVQQKIFTYDAKVREDFFLYSKTENQADIDADRYSPGIWDEDQDLVAMRNHISTEFIDIFNRGRDEYLAGNWPEAIGLLKLADKIMFQCEVDEGFSHKSYNENFKSNFDGTGETEEGLSMGDGPCQRLIAYMEELGGEAPNDWSGYRPLTSK